VSLTRLEKLYLDNNQISNLSPLSGLNYLRELYLNNNEISDIGPLVSNAGISNGDDVGLRCNPSNENSIYVDIPALEARGVNVEWVPPDAVESPEPHAVLLLAAGVGVLVVLRRVSRRM